MIQPFEMKETRPMKLHGSNSTTTDVWQMLAASQRGDLDRVKDLAQHCPALLTCQYDYTSPLHFAVREGHLDLVRYLVEQAGLDPNCRNHPYLEPLVTLAEDCEYAEIVEFLQQSLADPTLRRTWKDTGKIDHGADINAIDEEYYSTPLGHAAHWGHRDKAALLLERGADVNRAGAPWATPLAWARKKGLSDIEADLLEAGAQ